MSFVTDQIILNNVKRNGKRSRKKEVLYYEINGEIYPKNAVSEVICKIPGDFPIAIESDPGTGKSYFCTNALPIILEEMYDKKYIVLYTNPFQLKSPADVFVRPSLKQNNLVWENTWPIISVKEAIKENYSILWVIEEYTRMNAQMQNMFLELLNSGGSIHIEQTGEQIILPANSKIVLIGNPTGVGVTAKLEAIRNRVKKLKWPLPEATVIAEMVLNKIEQNENSYVNKTLKFKNTSIKLKKRKMNFDTALIITEAALLMNEVREKEPITLRGILKCCDYFITCEDISVAIDYMMEEFCSDLDVNSSENKRSMYNAKNKLREFMDNERICHVA